MGYGIIAINFIIILLMFSLRTVGASLFTGQKNIEVMSALPVEKAATASSVATTASSLGASVGVSLASFLVTFQLHRAGYYGPVLSAHTELLSSVIGLVIIISAGICFFAAIASFYRNMGLNQDMGYSNE